MEEEVRSEIRDLRTMLLEVSSRLSAIEAKTAACIPECGKMRTQVAVLENQVNIALDEEKNESKNRSTRWVAVAGILTAAAAWLGGKHG
jgi:hypothetical protein